jgi:hypothetical protein
LDKEEGEGDGDTAEAAEAAGVEEEVVAEEEGEDVPCLWPECHSGRV